MQEYVRMRASHQVLPQDQMASALSAIRCCRPQALLGAGRASPTINIQAVMTGCQLTQHAGIIAGMIQPTAARRDAQTGRDNDGCRLYTVKFFRLFSKSSLGHSTPCTHTVQWMQEQGDVSATGSASKQRDKTGNTGDTSKSQICALSWKDKYTCETSGGNDVECACQLDAAET